MKVEKYTDIKLEEVNVDGAKNASIRWLISEKDGAPNFALRMFEVKPGGFTPFHKHNWEHEVFCLEGEGVFVSDEEDKPFTKWDVIFVDPNKNHQFRNVGENNLVFLCIIPHQNTKPVPKKNINPFSGGTVNNC